MENKSAFEMIEKYAPDSCQNLCGILQLLEDEIEKTKGELTKQLVRAQEQNDYTSAREILDLQEWLNLKAMEIRDIYGSYVEGVAFDDFVTEDELNEDVEIGKEKEKTDKDRVDYTQFDTDETIAYGIDDIRVTFTRPAAVSIDGVRTEVKTWKDVLEVICNTLYRENPQIMRNMVGIKTGEREKRSKFSFEKKELRRPVKISGSSIWIETNLSAKDICKLIVFLLDNYRISKKRIKLYISRDYAELHTKEENMK